MIEALFGLLFAAALVFIGWKIGRKNKAEEKAIRARIYQLNKEVESLTRDALVARVRRPASSADSDDAG